MLNYSSAGGVSDDVTIKAAAKLAMQSTGHKVIDTPHLVLAVVRRINDRLAGKSILVETFGTTHNHMYVAIADMPKPNLQPINGRIVLYTEAAQMVLDVARQYVDASEGQLSYPDCLVAAIAVGGDESFVFMMDKLGIDREEFTAKMTALLEQHGVLARV